MLLQTKLVEGKINRVDLWHFELLWNVSPCAVCTTILDEFPVNMDTTTFFTNLSPILNHEVVNVWLILNQPTTALHVRSITSNELNHSALVWSVVRDNSNNRFRCVTTKPMSCYDYSIDCYGKTQETDLGIVTLVPGDIQQGLNFPVA